MARVPVINPISGRVTVYVFTLEIRIEFAGWMGIWSAQYSSCTPGHLSYYRRKMADFYAIILAAGQSSRMGREKSSLPWLRGQPLLLWMVEELAAGGWQPVVVLSPQNFAFWNSALPRGCAVANPEPERGKTTSLAAGVQRVPPDAKWLLITAVDQPRPRALYCRLREAAQTHSGKILVPDRQGGRGHPVVLADSLRNQLLALDEGSEGLRGLLDAHREETCRLRDCNPAWLRWDLNTPGDYEEALEFFQSQLAERDQP
jgi:molybdenum cofactor cytidylyltransferase